jgi:hypothetical protein
MIVETGLSLFHVLHSLEYGVIVRVPQRDSL